MSICDFTANDQSYETERLSIIKQNGKSAFERGEHYFNPYSNGPDNAAKLAWDEGWIEAFNEYHSDFGGW